MKTNKKFFAKKSIDRVDGLDRARQLTRQCTLQPQQQRSTEGEMVFTFERKNNGGKGRALNGDLRISTAIQHNKKDLYSVDLSLRFSASVCEKLALCIGDRIRAQASTDGIWHIDLSKPARGNALVASHSKSGTLYVRFAIDADTVDALGLTRHGDDIPYIDCDLIEIDGEVAVFCSK